MNHPRIVRTSLALASVLAVLGTAGCSSSSDAGGDASPATTTSAVASTTAANSDATDAEPGITDLRGVRYCEVLLLTEGDEGFQAAVWNTMGMSDCPDEQWDALDAKTIATERDAVVALLNGPRYWTLDSISTDLRAGAPETTFGEVAMFQAATVDLGDELPSQTPYTERPVARDTVFGFDEGSEVYELTGPDGATYVMQSWSQTIDPELSEADLAGLGQQLELPDGWSFATRTLTADLDVLSTDGVATVVQDELQNTYQRIDEP